MNTSTQMSKHAKRFQPMPGFPVPSAPAQWECVTVSARVVETGNMVESWFGQMVAETRTLYNITVDGNTLAEAVDYDTAYAFIQAATKTYRADERRAGLSLLKNACDRSTSGGYNTITIRKASEAYRQRVGGELSFKYFLA